MDRTVPFDEDEICDSCGAKGAYDFMGDCICAECLAKAKANADQPGSDVVRTSRTVSPASERTKAAIHETKTRFSKTLKNLAKR